MFNKKTTFLLLTLIFITMIGVSAVTAADNNNFTADTPVMDEITTESVDNSIQTTDVSTKNTQITKNIKTDVKSEGEGSFADLETDIAGSEVKLAKDYVQGEDETNITITENKVIDADGHTITATKGIFNIPNGTTLTFKNAIVSSSHGPTYSNYWYDLYNKGSLIVNNVTFKYNSPDRTYGGEIWTGVNSTLTVTDSVFDGEHTVRSQIYADGLNYNINIDKCTFKNYNASNAAIGLNKAGNLTVTNSVFQDNLETSYGGGIYINARDSVVLIDNCTFENLIANYRGGGIYTQGITTVKNSVFKKLRQKNPTYNAGAIYQSNNYAVLTLSNNTMEDIVANAANIYIEGGKLNSSLYVTGADVAVDQESPVTLTYNVTDDMGNSIDFKNSPFIMSINDERITTTFGNGTLSASFDASYDPGEYPINITCDETNLMAGATITKNTLTVNDIGLLNYIQVQDMIDDARTGATIKIDGPVFRGASEDNIVINKSGITLDFNGNTLNAKSGRVFNIDNVQNVKIQNAVITNVGNKQAYNDNVEGRVAFINNSYVEISNVNFTDSIAPSNGYAASGSFILAFSEEADSVLKMDNCNIENCSGTFINSIKNNVYLDNVNFENNNLYLGYSSSWNSLIADGGYLEVRNSKFINNTPNFAAIDGQSQSLPTGVYGSTFLTNNDELIIDNCTFINNSKGSKGAVHTNNNTKITNSIFIGNSANSYSGYGGAIRSDNGYLDIEKCIFVNNSAYYSVSSWSGSVSGNDGTAIYNTNGDLNIKDSLIISNITQFSAIYNTASDVSIDINGNYWGNDTPEGFYKSSTSGAEITVDDWVVLDITVKPEENNNYRDNITVKAVFCKNTDGSQVTTLPDYDNVSFASKMGELEKESVEVVGCEATTTFTIGNSPFVITATYPNMEAEYVGEAVMPEPKIITLNDGNWTTYFNDDGTPNMEIIVPNSELRFEGEFNDRFMLITVPLNLTTADTQGVLKNSPILVLSDNVNITKLQMIGQDTEEALILSEDANNINIEENTLTVNNTQDKIETRSIVIDGGSNIRILKNNITTIGPEDNIAYASSGIIRTIYLSSIEVNSANVLISENKITTQKNENPSEELGTIYGIYIHGKDANNPLDSADIVNNEIITESDVYAYGIKASFVKNVTISNNTVKTESKNFASGIHPYSIFNSVIENNKVTSKSDEIAYGIVLEGSMDYDTYDVYTSEENLVTSNIVDIESNFGWAIETFVGEKNNITYNNITVTVNNGLGIGLTDRNSVVSYNNIVVNAKDLNASATSFDYIDPYATGVKITNNNIQSVQYNAITFNNITVTAPANNVYGVNSSTNRNNITDNFIISPAGLGDAGVLETGRYGTLKDNTPSSLLTDETYSEFFDENCALKPEFNNAVLKASGDFEENTIFIFDNVNVTLTNDGTAVFHEGQIMTGNNATVVFDGLVFENSMDAFVLESEGNTINNTIIKINSEDPIHAIYVYENGNTIANTILNITAPSADVEYNSDYSVKAPAPAAIVINSDNNLLDNVTVFFDGTSSTGSWPTVDGIYLVSDKTPIQNNTIKDSTVEVIGANYVYGVNVGNAKDTTIENINVKVDSAYYSDAIQLFDADTITITGTATATATSEAYGVYSTAMGTGYSKNIDLTGYDVTVTAAKATGVLIEGSQNVLIAGANYNITGDDATAINAHIDFMNNIPTNITITGLDIAIDTTGDSNVLYFGKADSITITENNIETTGGSKINFNETTNAEVTNNYILIGDMMSGSFGDYAVMTTEEDTVVENNTPTSKIVDDLNQQIEDLQNELDQLKAPKATTLTLDPITDAKYNTNITIKGTLVNEDSIGLFNQVITLTIGDKTVDVITKNGEFEYTTSFKTLEEQTVTATYAGNDKYNASEDTITFTLEKGDVIVTVDEISEVAYGDNVTITGKFTTSDGKAISNSNVKITINGKKYYAKTDKTGKYTLSVKVSAAGINNVTVGYSGNTNYNAYEDTTTFNAIANNVEVTYEPISDVTLGDNVTITGTFKDANGKAITNSNVKITINGKKYYAKTDSTGKYTLSVATTKEGVNNVTIGYSGSEKYNAYETNTTFTVLKAQ